MSLSALGRCCWVQGRLFHNLLAYLSSIDVLRSDQRLHIYNRCQMLLSRSKGGGLQGQGGVLGCSCPGESGCPGDNFVSGLKFHSQFVHLSASIVAV